MVRLPKALRDAGLKARMLLQVHDELVLEVPEDEAEATGALLRGLMLDWILQPDEADRAAVFEETVAAFLRGVAVPLDERSIE